MFAAKHNSERWHAITHWQRESRGGAALLDSVVLSPEPELAERMLGLEGDPPENPGKVMALGDVQARDDWPRLHVLIEALLTPFSDRLGQFVARSDTFDVVIQSSREEDVIEIRAVWEKMELAGQPVMRWLDNSHEIGMADRWFEDDWRPYSWSSSYGLDRTPKYRLLLSWHLNDPAAGEPPPYSEAAVALLFGSAALLAEKPDIRPQAWLLRQCTGAPDQVESSLGWLLKAEQVPAGRIHHFWHAGLKGLAQHATLGAVKESALKVSVHAIDPAIGPQGSVARWLLPALAAKMAQFGQGAQLVALPHAQGIALNVVAKEPARVAVPWKPEYGYDSMMLPEIGMFGSIWAIGMLFSPKGWNTGDTIITCVVIGMLLAFFLYRIRRRLPAIGEAIAEFVMGFLPF